MGRSERAIATVPIKDGYSWLTRRQRAGAAGRMVVAPVDRRAPDGTWAANATPNNRRRTAFAFSAQARAALTGL